jgi:peptidoglycan-associated lipoprotein
MQWRYKQRMMVAGMLAVTMVVAANCSSKKKTTPVQQQTVSAPVQQPTSAPQVRDARTGNEQVAKPEVSVFTTVYFDYDQSSIREDQRTVLNMNAEILSKNRNVRIQIAGNCDERGTEEYNLALGQRRADAVKTYLTTYGVDSSRITTVTYGEQRPADNGSTEAAWAKNRRCDFSIVSGQ